MEQHQTPAQKKDHLPGGKLKPAIEHNKRRLATWMQNQSGRLSPMAQRLLFALFLFATSAYLILIIAGAFQVNKVLPDMGAIAPPAIRQERLPDSTMMPLPPLHK